MFGLWLMQSMPLSPWRLGSLLLMLSRKKLPQVSGKRVAQILIPVLVPLMVCYCGQPKLDLMSVMPCMWAKENFIVEERASMDCASKPAICDHHRRFTDVYIGHPGLSPIKALIDKEDFIAPGLALFGDNAYMNSATMVTPFKNCAINSDEDNFNFYQSQLRINIECAFGMFTQRWGILRKPINASMGVPKIIALVSCLCRLHNYCIDAKVKPDKLYPRDECDIHITDGLPAPIDQAKGDDIPAPQALIGAGEHFEGIPEYERKKLEKLARTLTYPRVRLCNMVAERGLTRPKAKKPRTVTKM